MKWNVNLDTNGDIISIDTRYNGVIIGFRSNWWVYGRRIVPISKENMGQLKKIDKIIHGIDKDVNFLKKRLTFLIKLGKLLKQTK